MAQSAKTKGLCTNVLAAMPGTDIQTQVGNNSLRTLAHSCAITILG